MESLSLLPAGQVLRPPRLSTLINQLYPAELARAYYHSSFRHKPKENLIHNHI